MGVSLNNNNNAIKFRGELVIPLFGEFVIDTRIKAGDVVLWSFITNDASGDYAPCTMVTNISDGQIYFYPDALIYDPGANEIKIAYIVFDKTKINL